MSRASLLPICFNEDSDAEIERLDDRAFRASLDRSTTCWRGVMYRSKANTATCSKATGCLRTIKGWVRRLEEAIRNGLTCEAAVEKVQSDTRARMIHMTDPYLRERLHDFDDLANRLLRQLTGFVPGGSGLPQDAIIVARAMGAAELLDYPREAVRGLVLEDGAVTSHVVIVARAMGIPVVGQVVGAPSLAENRDSIIVDGEDGTVHLRPMADLQSAYADKVRFRAKRQEQFRALRTVEPRTRDGQDVSLQMNAGLLVDLPQLVESGASGIGLFRTELQFMIASTMPKVDEQEKLYRNVLRQAGDRPVTFRTLDIGGDKVVPYFRSAEEENPALGWRAIRLSLDRPGLLRTQLRALLKAAAGAELKLMLPMVTEINELRLARELLNKEVRHLSRFGHQLADARCSSAPCWKCRQPDVSSSNELMRRRLDFVSDRLQRPVPVHDGRGPRQFAQIADRASNRVWVGRSCGHCGSVVEAASRAEPRYVADAVRRDLPAKPLSAMALVGDRLSATISMSPAAIGPVKADAPCRLDLAANSKRA
jgi:phosphotransferase system enzyme I (PtsP)